MNKLLALIVLCENVSLFDSNLQVESLRPEFRHQARLDRELELSALLFSIDDQRWKPSIERFALFTTECPDFTILVNGHSETVIYINLDEPGHVGLILKKLVLVEIVEAILYRIPV